MNVSYPGLKRAEDPIVYVREIRAAELPEELREGLTGAEKLYAVHAEDGERLAVTRERDLAFALARQHHYTPVAVH